MERKGIHEGCGQSYGNGKGTSNCPVYRNGNLKGTGMRRFPRAFPELFPGTKGTHTSVRNPPKDGEIAL